MPSPASPTLADDALLLTTKTAAWRALSALPGAGFEAACQQHLSADSLARANAREALRAVA